MRIGIHIEKYSKVAKLIWSNEKRLEQKFIIVLKFALKILSREINNLELTKSGKN